MSLAASPTIRTWPDVIVVVPAWNEERSVAEVVEGITSLALDIVVVDDGSTDRTAEVARKAGARVLQLPINLGVGGALRCGFKYAVQQGFHTVVQCDADGQHPPTAIVELLKALDASGADLLLGSRFGNDPYDVGRVRRRVMRRLARSASRACGVPITDATSGFRSITGQLLREFARSFPDSYLGDTYEALVTAGRAGYLVQETNIAMRPRQFGASSASKIASVRFTVRALVVASTRLSFRIEPKRAPSPISPTRG